MLPIYHLQNPLHKIQDLTISIQLKERGSVHIELFTEIGMLLSSDLIENITELSYSPIDKLIDYRGLVFCKTRYNNKQYISKLIIE